VPFAALLDRDSGRFLLEDHPIVVAPSLNTLVALRRDRSAGLGRAPSVLAIADPSFDRDLFDRLDRLPGTEREAAVIASLFPGARLLAGTQVTRDAVLSALGEHEIVHVGAHAVANSRSPFLSSLLLAPDPERADSGVLYARDLLDIPFSATRLVVLAACRSAGAAEPGSEGIAGLVWPFLARGVPEIIATLRPIDDQSSAEILIAFYRHLAATGEPLEALRQAQLEALAASGRSPSTALTWAAFQLYGAAPSIE
jgi:CHAT domain-containing protein